MTWKKITEDGTQDAANAYLEGLKTTSPHKLDFWGITDHEGDANAHAHEEPLLQPGDLTHFDIARRLVEAPDTDAKDKPRYLRLLGRNIAALVSTMVHRHYERHRDNPGAYDHDHGLGLLPKQPNS